MLPFYVLLMLITASCVVSFWNVSFFPQLLFAVCKQIIYSRVKFALSWKELLFIRANSGQIQSVSVALSPANSGMRGCWFPCYCTVLHWGSGPPYELWLYVTCALLHARQVTTGRSGPVPWAAATPGASQVASQGRARAGVVGVGPSTEAAWCPAVESAGGWAAGAWGKFSSWPSSLTALLPPTRRSRGQNWRGWGPHRWGPHHWARGAS